MFALKIKLALVLQAWLATGALGYWFAEQSTDTDRQAIVNFNNIDGVKGFIKFSQRHSFDPVIIQYDLEGLQGNVKLFHVHERPVPPYDLAQVQKNASMLTQLCSGPAVGGHFNPYKITAKIPAATGALNQYEVGDLSGKHGPFRLAGDDKPEHFAGYFIDDKLSLSGPNNIIGKSIVIHKLNGDRWVCASIVEQQRM